MAFPQGVATRRVARRGRWGFAGTNGKSSASRALPGREAAPRDSPVVAPPAIFFRASGSEGRGGVAEDVSLPPSSER